MTHRPRDIYSEATVYKIIHTSGAKKIVLISSTIQMLPQCKYAGRHLTTVACLHIRRPNTAAGLKVKGIKLLEIITTTNYAAEVRDVQLSRT